MKKEKYEKSTQQVADSKQEKIPEETSTPTDSDQLNQNFRQNSGPNSEDLKTAPDGSSDFH